MWHFVLFKLHLNSWSHLLSCEIMFTLSASQIRQLCLSFLVKRWIHISIVNVYDRVQGLWVKTWRDSLLLNCHFPNSIWCWLDHDLTVSLLEVRYLDGMCCQKDSYYNWHFHVVRTLVSEFLAACDQYRFLHQEMWFESGLERNH